MGSGVAATVGTIGGFLVGGPMGASVGGGIGSGIDGYSDERQNRKINNAYTAFNITQLQQANDYNNSLILANAEMQSAAALSEAAMFNQAANLQAQGIMGKAQLDASIALKTAEYRAEALAHEARILWNRAGLAQDQFQKQMDQQEGAMVASFGASGISLDNPEDSYGQAILSHQTETALELAIMKDNAQIEVDNILDAAAMGRWEGNMAAKSALAQGFMSASQIKLQGTMKALSAQNSAAMGMFSANLQADMNDFSTSQQAMQMTWDNYLQNYESEQRGNASLTSGLTSSISPIFNPSMLGSPTSQSGAGQSLLTG